MENCLIWRHSKLQTFQNKALKIIVKWPWYVRNNQSHYEPKEDFIKKTALEIFTKEVALGSAIQVKTF